jgi:hypothetical protein
MNCNVGSADKIVRYIIGVVILLTGFAFKNWLGLIGLIPIVTAFVGWCPLYLLFKINTNKKAAH